MPWRTKLLPPFEGATWLEPTQVWEEPTPEEEAKTRADEIKETAKNIRRRRLEVKAALLFEDMKRTLNKLG